ncbi:MAG: HEPN domain-containing protein [Bacteroidetes bacterium]|nr:HEPN domain-containing protein [Bacteroidota bacterium]
MHPLRILLENLRDCASEIQEKIVELEKNNENTIKNLDKAYLTSRYYPINFTEQEILGMLDFVKELKSILNILWNT